MVKNVFVRLKTLLSPDALVFLGWLSFIVGMCVTESIGLKLTLLSAARVLPSAFIGLPNIHVSV